MSLTEERRKEIEAIVEAVSVSLRRDIPVMPYQSALVDVWAALTAAESRAQAAEEQVKKQNARIRWIRAYFSDVIPHERLTGFPSDERDPGGAQT